jgi:hypothetical protein
MSKKWNQDAVMKLLQKRKEEENSSYTDQRFWVPAPPSKSDKKGEAVYRIRILPNMKAGGEYSVKLNKHMFQAPSGTWVVENCPSTLGQKCPIDEYAGPFFNTGDPKDKTFASSIYRKKNFIANILVVKDPRNNGENEGKVFLYRYGTQIHEKFDSAMFPNAESGMEQIMFIDPYKGYDFNLVVTLKKDGQKEFPNYANSVFVRESTPIAKSDENVDKILESCFDLETEFLSPKQFKSYEELKKILEINVINYRKDGNVSSEKKEDKQSKKETSEETTSTKTQGKKVEEESESTDDDFLKSLEEELKK